jgi:hypothetical protein
MLFRHLPGRWVTLPPFVSLLFDYLENATIVTMLTSYPSQSIPVAVIGEVVKLVKWLLVGTSIGLILYGLMLNVSGRITPTKS